MAEKTIEKKAGQLVSRDWLIAAGTAVFTAVAAYLLDHFQVAGLSFDFKQIASVAAIAFLQHVLRKLPESGTITVEK